MLQTFCHKTGTARNNCKEEASSHSGRVAHCQLNKAVFQVRSCRNVAPVPMSLCRDPTDRRRLIRSHFGGQIGHGRWSRLIACLTPEGVVVVSFVFAIQRPSVFVPGLQFWLYPIVESNAIAVQFNDLRMVRQSVQQVELVEAFLHTDQNSREHCCSRLFEFDRVSIMIAVCKLRMITDYSVFRSISTNCSQCLCTVERFTFSKPATSVTGRPSNNRSVSTSISLGSTFCTCSMRS